MDKDTKMSAEEVAAGGFVVKPTANEETGRYGFCILVVDRGFVWIGDCMRQGDTMYTAGGYNIRTWGAPKGLGQLATTGPTAETELDACPVIITPMRAVIHIIPANPAAWPAGCDVKKSA